MTSTICVGITPARKGMCVYEGHGSVCSPVITESQWLQAWCPAARYQAGLEDADLSSKAVGLPDAHWLCLHVIGRPYQHSYASLGSGGAPGEIAKITIKHEFAYGEQGQPPQIPPRATLMFEIEVISWIAKDAFHQNQPCVSHSSPCSSSGRIVVVGAENSGSLAS